MAQHLYEQWFRIADADKDGAVGGAEAVSFFTRSGLPQAVLGQIWELASGGGAQLNQIQFSAAMRLVALAQARGGQLPLDQARAIIAGTGPDLPPPSLHGLEGAGATAPGAAPPAAAGPRPVGVAPVPGVLPYSSGPTAAVPQYNVQLTGGAAAPGAGAPPPYAAGVARPAVGAPVGAVGPTAGLAPAPAVAAAPSGYPPLPAPELQRYQAAFRQLDADKDGFVTGGECFGFFTQSGLDKAVLRDIWSLVAGENSHLSVQQFIAFLYVMDLVKRGMPLPKYLPPGLAGFPPVAAAPPGPGLPNLAAAAAPVAAPPAAAATWSLQSQFGTSSNITAVLASPPATSLPAPPPPPAMPAKLELSASERFAPPLQHVSHVPAVPAALLAGVSAMDRTKLQEEQQVCEAKEKALQTVEERAAEARARQAKLTTALQELVVFRNRTEVALLTSQDQARRLEEEVEATRKRYDAGYAAAQAASDKSAAVHAHLMELMGQKAEMEEKMRRLEAEVAAAERMGPADVARLEGELAELHSKGAALEVARNAKMAQVDGLRRQQDAARAQLADLQDADRDAAAEVEACRASLACLEGDLQEARASGVVATLPSLLSRAAVVYRGLYGLAHRTGTAVPFEALPATLEGLHVWADEVAAGVVDWADDDVDARGYVVVNALPGADAPRPILKPAASQPGAAGTAPMPKRPPVGSADPAASAFDGAARFDDPPAFGDAPAFGIPAGVSASAAAAPPPPSAVAAALTPPPVATPSAPVDFGFGDAPAFGAPAPASFTPPAPTASAAAAIDSLAVAKAVGAVERSAAWDDPAERSRLGSGFSFDGKQAERSVETQQAVVVPPAPESRPPGQAAAAAFEDNAFGSLGSPSPSFAAAAVAAAGPTGDISVAPADGPPAETTSFFGDDAFGAPSGFGGGFAAVAPAIAAAVAVAAPAHSPSSSSGGAPSSGLPPMDSGPLESNPFAWGATPPALAAFTGDAASGLTSQAPVAAAGGAPGAAASGAFGDDAFSGSGDPSGSPGAAAPPPPPPPAPSSSIPAAALGPSTPAVGFGDENPFGDSDNPFGTPAFP